jgi:luciferase family oxidoreductase group 1
MNLAPRIEHLGFSRLWLGEHHGRADQSGSPEVLSGIVASITERIRVGPAGVLLQYYSPYKVAQDHRLLQQLFGTRIDLGVARGLGGDGEVTRALLDGRPASVERYEEKVEALARLLHGEDSAGGGEPLEVLGGVEASPEFWVLGASVRAASLAGRLGASFGFSDYFARMVDPTVDGAAIVRGYRDAFQPSLSLPAPRWNVAVAGAASAGHGVPPETHALAGVRPVVGSATSWRAYLSDTAERYECDEVIVFDLCTRIADRRRSLEVLAEAADLQVAV